MQGSGLHDCEGWLDTSETERVGLQGAAWTGSEKG